MLNRSASLAMSTCVLKALLGKLDIKRHPPSILYLLFNDLEKCSGNDLEKMLLITEIDLSSFLPGNLVMSPIREVNIFLTPIGDLLRTTCIFLSQNEDILILVW